MPEKSQTDLPRGVREQFEKGVAALDRSNLDYAIELLLGVVKAEPGFLGGREALRRAAHRKAGEKTGLLKKLVSSAGSSPALARAKFLVESQPLEAMFLAEQVLASDPRSGLAHDLFARAAMAAELPRSAILSLEAMRQESPADKDTSIRLAEALSALGQSDKAEAVFAALLRHHPNDPRLNEMAKNISAARTLNEGGYESIAEGKGSFRDILKDKKEAARLEQESRITKDATQSQNLIEQYLARLTTDPTNLRLLKNVAELYAQQKDYFHSIHYYNLIEQIPGAMDATLEQARNDVILKRFNQVIEQIDPAAEDYEAQKAAIVAERDAFILNDCLARVEKYPTDKAIRFELGLLYFNQGRIIEAQPEFQQAENNPQRRVQAMLYSARCMTARNMNDMAARKLQNALKEKQGFDDERKELLYTLGIVLEKMGKAEDSIKQFMDIYEVDMKFRDVEERVNRHYSGQG